LPVVARWIALANVTETSPVCFAFQIADCVTSQARASNRSDPNMPTARSMASRTVVMWLTAFGSRPPTYAPGNNPVNDFN
jgi:hypothetical protein